MKIPRNAHAAGFAPLHGTFADGYTPQTVKAANSLLQGVALIAQWERWDEYGPCGHSQLYIRRHDNAHVTEIPGDLFEHLTDPASSLNLTQIGLYGGEPPPSGPLHTFNEFAFAYTSADGPGELAAHIQL